MKLKEYPRNGFGHHEEKLFLCGTAGHMLRNSWTVLRNIFTGRIHYDSEIGVLTLTFSATAIYGRHEGFTFVI